MVTAIIMVKADRNAIPQTAQEIADMDGVAEVYSTSGDYDIIAILRVHEYEELAQLVTERMLKIPTIVGTQTHMAFRAYGKSAMEHVFDIGADE